MKIQHIRHKNSTYLKFDLLEHSNLDDEILRNDTWIWTDAFDFECGVHDNVQFWSFYEDLWFWTFKLFPRWMEQIRFRYGPRIPDRCCVVFYECCFWWDDIQVGSISDSKINGHFQFKSVIFAIIPCCKIDQTTPSIWKYSYFTLVICSGRFRNWSLLHSAIIKHHLFETHI